MFVLVQNVPDSICNHVSEDLKLTNKVKPFQTQLTGLW